MALHNAQRLSARLANAFVLDLVKLGAHGRDIIDPLIRSALMQVGIGPVMRDPKLQLRFATFDCDIPDDLRRPASVNGLATSLGVPFETVRRRIHAFAAEGACIAVGRRFVVPSTVTSSPFFHMACTIQYAKLLAFHDQLREAGAVPAQVSSPRNWPAPPVRLAGRFVVEFVLRFRELIAVHVPDAVSSVVFMDILAANVEALPLTRDGGLGAVFGDSERIGVSGHQIAQRLSIPDETVRRHIATLVERGLVVRGRKGWIVPGARLASPEFEALFADNHRNVVRLFGHLAEYDALRPVEATHSSDALRAG